MIRGPGLLHPLRHPVLPDPRVLDEVVIDGNDLVVVLQWHEAVLVIESEFERETTVYNSLTDS